MGIQAGSVRRVVRDIGYMNYYRDDLLALKIAMVLGLRHRLCPRGIHLLGRQIVQVRARGALPSICTAGILVASGAMYSLEFAANFRTQTFARNAVRLLRKSCLRLCSSPSTLGTPSPLMKRATACCVMVTTASTVDRRGWNVCARGLRRCARGLQRLCAVYCSDIQA